jgi:diguanylate cyclase (GGDEF)-like protein
MKSLRVLLRLDVMENPDDLFRLFITTAVTSIIVILFLVGVGFHGVLNRYVLEDAEQESIKIAKAVLFEESRQIIAASGSGSSQIRVMPDDIPRLDQHLRKLLSIFDIVKIKIYTSDKKIAYSTDKAIIGEVNKFNLRLDNALNGQYDSHVERKEAVKDLADEQKFNVDVVETYIPIRGNDNKVIGCFEVYVDVTQYRKQVYLAVALSVSILATTLAMVFGLSFLLIRKETENVKKLQEMLRWQAITDPLTGIFNKKQIISLIRLEFSRLRRERQGGQTERQLGCIMIDIDGFKQINDTHGHLAGDALLLDIAQRISSSLRAHDIVGRFGGDEFIAVLPATNLDQSCQVAQKLCSLMRDAPFTLHGASVTVTLSLGVAVAETDDADYNQMLKRADDALYRAKDRGRDRYVC